jgi:hypothetical protein
MFASHYISDAAVFPPLPPRGGFGLQPSDDKSAEGRRVGLIASLRGLFAAHASAPLPSSRGIGR